MIVVLLLAAGAGAFLYFSREQKPEQPVVETQKEEAPPKELVKKDVEPGKLPDKFPSGIPMEQGATITQNYNATAPDGRFQATRVFETKKTLEENITIYKNYLEEAGYSIDSTLDRPEYKMVFGRKGRISLQVSVNQNVKTGIRTVSIEFAEQPANPVQAQPTSTSSPSGAAN